MKSRTLLILALLVGVAILASTLLNRQRGISSDAVSGQLLLPGLSDSLNDISVVKLLVSGDDGGVTFEKRDNGWVIAEKNDYAADTGKIRQFLIRLGEARVLEQKTSNPELFERLGVEDIGTDTGSGALVGIVGLDQALEIVVGDLETRAGNGTYVRRMGQNQSYLVDSELVPARNPMDWLDRQILDIPSTSVKDILVTHSDGESIHLVRIAKWMVVWGLPENRELTSPTAAESMSTLFANLNLEDVMPADEFEGGDPDATAVYQIADGRMIDVAAWKTDAGDFLTLAIAMAPEQGDEPWSENEPEETDADSLAEEASAPRANPAEVARSNARLENWVFKVSPAKYDLVVRRLEDMLKPLEDPES
jgi:hypothetical protein